MWLMIIGSIVAIIGLIYYWLTVQYKYFEKRGVPGPKPKFLLGNVPSMFTQSRNMTYDYDDIYQ